MCTSWFVAWRSHGFVPLVTTGSGEHLLTARHRPEDYAEVVRGKQGSAIKDVIVFTPG
ncbi:hypothetical protein KYC5002_32795 [Archangium violaceum]|uniref:hypothetical protein n=1 Tax=Archangium violaceum TaxID=83451 RepID=UPI002B302C69|nr:hypothetical protein KYC5002_32795 [Archangium gephyra]